MMKFRYKMVSEQQLISVLLHPPISPTQFLTFVVVSFTVSITHVHLLSVDAGYTRAQELDYMA